MLAGRERATAYDRREGGCVELDMAIFEERARKSLGAAARSGMEPLRDVRQMRELSMMARSES